VAAVFVELVAGGALHQPMDEDMISRLVDRDEAESV
jgi:hypothetical protein